MEKLPIWRKNKNKTSRPAFYAFLDKLQVFFEVVGHCKSSNGKIFITS